MIRRWAEDRLYKKTMQLAVRELRRAARSANALEKLHALGVAEQRLKDAAWLRPEKVTKEYTAGLAEIERSRLRSLHEMAEPTIERLLDAAEKDTGERTVMLEAAAALIAFLNHWLPDEANSQIMTARLRRLGGKQVAYEPVQPLSEIYQRPERPN